MDHELAQARGRIHNLSTRLKIIDMRRAARWVLDQFRFGSGGAERLAAALVLGAVFFLGLLGATAASRMPTGIVFSVSGLALGTVVLTSAALVLGPSDTDLVRHRAEAVEALDAERVRAAELKAEIAERDAEREAKEAEREERRRRMCPYCGGRIRPWAAKCPQCHEYLDEELARERQEAMRPKPNTGVAAVLSFLIPGLGQIYKGQVLGGLVWFFLVQSIYVTSLITIGCCIGFLGIPVVIVLHLICIFDAASGG